MSCVIFLAADHPMPLYDPDLRRVTVSGSFTLEAPGFSVQAHEFFRDAVDSLGLEIKPFQYELNLGATHEDVEQLRTYLETNGTPGEQVELWNLWVGNDRGAVPVPHFHGRLSDLNVDTLEQLCHPPMRPRIPGQCRMTITI